MSFRLRYRLTEKQKITILNGAKEQLDNFICAEDSRSAGYSSYNVLRGFEPIVETKTMERISVGKQPSPVIISRDELEHIIEVLYFHKNELDKGKDSQSNKKLAKSEDMIKRLVHL